MPDAKIRRDWRLVVKSVTQRYLFVLAASVAVFIMAVPMFAHHGTAAFDTSKAVTVKGTVTEFVFLNPHVQIYFDVKNDKGEMEKWQGELTAPNKLARAGWTKKTLQPGDTIEVTGFRVQSGGNTLWIRKLVDPHGESLPLFED
jgi:uncharacterized cupredoxin-like copper-binding protein